MRIAPERPYRPSRRLPMRSGRLRVASSDVVLRWRYLRGQRRVMAIRINVRVRDPLR